jgi:predicted transcriptional regulator
MKLIVAILLLSAVPALAQAQQPNTANLKADAQNKAKNQIYCQIADLGEQVDQEKDSKKAAALFQKMNELEKQLGPEYIAFVEAIRDVDPNSRDGQDIVTMFDELDAACPD